VPSAKYRACPFATVATAVSQLPRLPACNLEALSAVHQSRRFMCQDVKRSVAPEHLQPQSGRCSEMPRPEYDGSIGDASGEIVSRVWLTT